MYITYNTLDIPILVNRPKNAVKLMMGKEIYGQPVKLSALMGGCGLYKKLVKTGCWAP